MPHFCSDSAPPRREAGAARLEPAVVRIGERLVGPGRRVYIIAEAGVNHDGSLAKALQLVDAAADAGADAVKFQVFRAATLVTPSAATAGYQRVTNGGSQRDMLAQLELSDADFERIAERCRQRSVQFLATPFSPPDVARLLRLGVPAIKIASTDLVNTLLLEEVVRTRLPIIASTGAATADEIRATAQWLRARGAVDRLIVMHCVSCYPVPLEAANLRAIGALHETLGVPCGFSDHTESTQTGAWAVAAGACVLEKHLTLDCSAAGPDHAMSLSPAEFTEYVSAVRNIEAALGSGALGMTDLEANVRAVARQSVVAAMPIRAGTPLSAEALTVKRPGGGIEPSQAATLVGRRLNADVAADTMITWDMIV